jgi:hypothetical protein
MSTLWAFGFFMALLSIVGHTTQHDDWRWIWYKIRGKDIPADEQTNSEPKQENTNTRTTVFIA